MSEQPGDDTLDEVFADTDLTFRNHEALADKHHVDDGHPATDLSDEEFA